MLPNVQPGIFQDNVPRVMRPLAGCRQALTISLPERRIVRGAMQRLVQPAILPVNVHPATTLQPGARQVSIMPLPEPPIVKAAIAARGRRIIFPDNVRVATVPMAGYLPTLITAFPLIITEPMGNALLVIHPVQTVSPASTVITNLS